MTTILKGLFSEVKSYFYLSSEYIKNYVILQIIVK
jgi:hypothetical protein